MTPIPPKLRKEIDSNPFYKNCALYGWHGHECEGRITMDHTIIYAGRQLQELWAITPVCAKAHGVDGYRDNQELQELRLWVALNRASAFNIMQISKAVSFGLKLFNLNATWGVWSQKTKNFLPESRVELNPATGIKKLWFTPRPEIEKMIETLCLFNKEMGYDVSKYGVIENAVRRDYENTEEYLAINDPKLFVKLGFK